MSGKRDKPYATSRVFMPPLEFPPPPRSRQCGCVTGIRGKDGPVAPLAHTWIVVCAQSPSVVSSDLDTAPVRASSSLVSSFLCIRPEASGLHCRSLRSRCSLCGRQQAVFLAILRSFPLAPTSSLFSPNPKGQVLPPHLPLPTHILSISVISAPLPPLSLSSRAKTVSATRQVPLYIALSSDSLITRVVSLPGSHFLHGHASCPEASPAIGRPPLVSYRTRSALLRTNSHDVDTSPSQISDTEGGS
ncbi:hypothetical protein C8Q80DRAFT_894141 [Daedaleopsis nitida]|nr:hypothetical protein C8Q80DRAFT_894141 [Daedaleopsis nitida]